MSKSSKTEVRDARISLRDAQAIIAREYGFASWPKLQSHIEAMTENQTGKSKTGFPSRLQNGLKTPPKFSGGLRKKLENTPTRQMGLDEIREVLVSMAEISRTEGILALEDFVDGSTKIEDWLRDNLRLALDGTEPKVLEDLLETQTQALVHSYETRCRMIAKGITALHSGDNPRIVDHKLCSFYKLQAQL